MRPTEQEYIEAKERLEYEQMPWEICELEKIVSRYENPVEPKKKNWIIRLIVDHPFK